MGCCLSKPKTKDEQKPHSSITPEIELTKAPTLGEGTPPLNESKNDSRPVINTSKMEVDKLSGNTFVNQYLIVRDIGDGSFGKVKMVLNTEDNCLYALKLVNKHQGKRGLLRGRGEKHEKSDNTLLHEINVMKSLRHPNVVRLYEVIDDPASEKLLMIMEYVDGGEIMPEDMIGRSKPGLSEQVARQLFRDLIKGLEFLHFRNIIHRDIKPGNLLLTQTGRVKLVDFGSAFYFPDGNDIVTDNAGTRLFFAPEACGQGIPYSGKKADIYAAGVVLYIMIFARPPFESPIDYELLRKIREEEPSFDSRLNLSSELVDLLQKLLCKDPESRLSLEEVMKHSWFTDQDNLVEIKSSRYLNLPPENDPSIFNESTGITLNMTSILDQIPNKQKKVFKTGEFVVREGQVINGWYLITKGHCEATCSKWDAAMESDFATGDLDFDEEDAEEELTASKLVSRTEGEVLPGMISNSDQDQSPPLMTAAGGLPKFQSLHQGDILKGIERRPTEKHGYIKQVVETAFQDYYTSSTEKFEISKTGRLRGPGSVVGLDLNLESMQCHQTVKALEEVHTLFVEKSALEVVLGQRENRLQVRLFVARLHRIEVMRNLVKNLASLHSDVILLEKLRAAFRERAIDEEVASTKDHEV
eukprot:g8212.t1